MKVGRLNRRRFILGTLLAVPALAAADAGWVEPNCVRVRTIRLAQSQPTHRLVHFTDLHHKGDRIYLEKVVKKINAQSPDFVCFTGDLIEEAAHLPEALKILAEIKSPLFGVPGNHDYWSKIPFGEIRDCFASTGGAWLMDERAVLAQGKLILHGAACRTLARPLPQPAPAARNLLLMHYPAWADRLEGRFDLILAGHSHGGQVRIPFWGAIHVPFDVEPYDLGLFQTKAGPLYVNPGIGWFYLPVRFNCRPEITVFEI